ncbi:uncharacterized protein LOC106818272 [Rhizophagus clarus]|uniref:Uncharacterized protein LOC106818272 n=1 Tax=Rhizophagus clarus TaxID=94130 RepID=A0A8H3LDG9_9GLOM|nr:uncharacterized protein LOC106818272 [Rhizophagus clarus]
MEPMVIALKLFESDSSILSSVYSHFKNLIDQINQIECDFSNKLQELIIRRWEYAYHPIMIISYMLDPQFLEESKNNGIEADGYTEFTTFTSEKFGHEESVELFAELVNFRNKKPPYNNEIIWKSINFLNNPSIWWQSWPNSKLQQLAVKIFLIPTFSAAAERNFSNFGFIHNKIRNRLTNDRVKKLVYIYGNLRIYDGYLKINSKPKKNQINDINEDSDDYNNSSDNDSSIIGFESNVMNLDEDE